MNAKKNSVSLSLIIPAYNEAQQIGKSLEQIFLFCNAIGDPYEVIVVDDGSTDETVSSIHRRFGDWSQLKIVQQPERRGKGAAVPRRDVARPRRLSLFLRR
jgi:dolichyl-phosphate beta-glucosyltransferase